MSSRGDDAPQDLFARHRRQEERRRTGPADDAGGRAPAARPGTRARPLSVTQVVRGVRNVIERELGYDVWLEGEASSVSRPSSGHVYFGLKDERSQLRVVMWRSDAFRLRFRIEDGQVLRCRGRPTIYTRDGKFQFQISYAEPAGLGADALALEQLRRRLAGEGLFDPARKRPLPLLPRRIGVVTSKSGAAVRDIIRTVERRFPVPILIADTAVQGPDAPARIVRALRDIARTDVEVVIVGRGGGDAGDLSAFNDERVVRAVAACPVPTISAVGHEVDVSLTDLAADHRAATPTAAGERAVPVLADLAALLGKEERRLHRELTLAIQDARQEIDQHQGVALAALERVMARGRHALTELRGQVEARHPRALLQSHRAEVAALEARLHELAERRLERHQSGLGELEQRARQAARQILGEGGAELSLLAANLRALSPLAVLERGYAIATGPAGALTRADEVAVGERVNVRLARGELDCRVEAVHASEDPAEPAEPTGGDHTP